MIIEEFLKKTYRIEHGMQTLRPRIVCNDGFSMSVQAGRCLYCSPRTDIESGDYFEVEIGFPSEKEDLICEYAEGSDYTETVYPYVPVELVDKVIEKHGGIMKELEITVMLDNGAIMPTKAHEDDAGFDLYAPERLVVMPHDSGVIDTGVHMAIPSGYVGMIKSKSGLNVNRGILCEGVVDSGYSGSIVAKIYNHSGQRKIFEKGDKLTQIVIMPIPRVKLVEGIVFSDTERGDNGFGSSGK